MNEANAIPTTKTKMSFCTILISSEKAFKLNWTTLKTIWALFDSACMKCTLISDEFDEICAEYVRCPFITTWLWDYSVRLALSCNRACSYITMCCLLEYLPKSICWSCRSICSHKIHFNLCTSPWIVSYSRDFYRYQQKYTKMFEVKIFR